MYKQIEKEILSLKNLEKAKILRWFFKTGKWDYGEWDVFLGITMLEQRKLIKKYFREVSFEDIQRLLESKYHEFRMVWLLFLVAKYESIKKTNKIPPTPLPKGGYKKNIFDFYVKNIEYVNNWDLVDVTCPKIVWDYLLDKDKSILYDFAKSENMWMQRIAIVSTWIFIRNWQFEDTLNLAEILINHKHDLIHKAVWWMLREIWKKDELVLVSFLDKNIKKIPRTTLRYSIERFDENKRKYYLLKK